MKRLPLTAYGLTRHSTGLTEAHKQLIRLLAARAVEDFLRESEAEAEAEQREEVAP